MDRQRKFDHTRLTYHPGMTSFRQMEDGIRLSVEEVLRRSPMIYDSHIEVRLQDRYVVLAGSVPNFEVRDAVETIVAPLFDNNQLINELVVRTDTYF